MGNEILKKAKQILAEADSGSDACKYYNDGFLDGVQYALKELRQPPVISSVCDCEPHTYYEWEKDENKCSQCGKLIYEQTDL